MFWGGTFGGVGCGLGGIGEGAGGDGVGCGGSADAGHAFAGGDLRSPSEATKREPEIHN